MLDTFGYMIIADYWIYLLDSLNNWILKGILYMGALKDLGLLVNSATRSCLLDGFFPVVLGDSAAEMEAA